MEIKEHFFGNLSAKVKNYLTAEEQKQFNGKLFAAKFGFSDEELSSSSNVCVGLKFGTKYETKVDICVGQTFGTKYGTKVNISVGLQH